MKQHNLFLIIVVVGIIFANNAFGEDSSPNTQADEIRQEHARLKALQDSLAMYTDSLKRVESPIGGAGRLNFRNSQIKGENAMTLGGQIALTYKQNWQFGLGAFGQVNSVEIEPSDTPDLICDVYLGYLGFEVTRYFHPEKKIHWGLSSLLGLGSLVVEDADAGTHDESLLNDNFLILEPALLGVVNLTKSITADLGLGFRLPIGLVENQYLETADLTGAVISVGLQFSVR